MIYLIFFLLYQKRINYYPPQKPPDSPTPSRESRAFFIAQPQKHHLRDATGRELAVIDNEYNVNWYIYGKERVASMRHQMSVGMSNLFITGNIPNGLHHARNALSTDGTVQSADEVILQAGDCVAMMPGFNTPDDADFTAEIKLQPVPQFIYYLYDHLGNTRVTYSVEVNAADDIDYVVESASDYYPYGKALRSYGKERYQSTYHERDTESGFDYRGARFYDGDVARFNSLDPLAADYPEFSDYLYVAANPLVFVDPTGKNNEEAQDNPEEWDGGWTENHQYLAEVFGNYDLADAIGSNILTRRQNEVTNNDNSIPIPLPVLITMMTGQQRHLTGPDAVGVELNLSVVGGMGASNSPVGGILILRGQDAGQIVGVSDVGVASGLDVSVSVVGTVYYYSGDEEQLNKFTFAGIRGEANASVSVAGVDIAAKGMFAPVDNWQNFVFGIGAGVGLSPPVPVKITGNINIGTTILWNSSEEP